MLVEMIETPSLGDRSYLVHDETVAIVIDPQRDTDRVTAAAEAAGVRVAAVAETHLHNDYVSGGYQLARELGVDYYVNAADNVAFDRRPVTDGEELIVGGLTVRVVATPGHTHTHLSYIITDGEQEAVFSGGSLLFGSVGRTDLVCPEDTDALTHAQFHSVRALTASADDTAALYPTHGSVRSAPPDPPPEPTTRPSEKSGAPTTPLPPTTRTASSPTSSTGSLPTPRITLT